MSSIFILGATGFIGLPVATALRRAGYIVYGHARTPEKARLLAQNEILPIQGDLNNLAHTLPPHIETIIDISGLYNEATTVLEQVKQIGGGRKPTDPKLAYIYTSGMGVYGSSSMLISEATPPNLHTPPAGLLSWRPDFEHQVLASRDVLDVLIIRPGLLYGGNGTLWSVYFDPIIKAVEDGAASVVSPGDPLTALPLVHKDELADLYGKAVDKLTVVAASTYPVINVPSHQEELGSILTASAKAIGYKGKLEYRASENGVEEALATVINTRPYKPMGLLSWVPRQIGFTQGMEVYAKTYLAWQE